ncbi:alpha/beta fold hydrolase [Rugosimonospora africana]|uniref:alpha/beta fold hydrolase n=1 Tax=Rugosimonospora africana TaxID=556532 RepID=UPI003570F618
MPHLAGRVPVVRVDFLGWGRSNKPAGYPYTATNQAGDLAAVIDAVGSQLDADRVVLVAHDASGPPAIAVVAGLWVQGVVDQVAEGSAEGRAGDGSGPVRGGLVEPEGERADRVVGDGGDDCLVCLVERVRRVSQLLGVALQVERATLLRLRFRRAAAAVVAAAVHGAAVVVPGRDVVARSTGRRLAEVGAVTDAQVAVAERAVAGWVGAVDRVVGRVVCSRSTAPDR